ncbi:MAG: enoyl-CoA hydratase-related protein [Mycetocola sp.]
MNENDGQLVIVDRSDPAIAIVTLNNPDKLNGLTPPLTYQLIDELDRLAADPQCRCIVLTGAGRGFCAGGDLDAVRKILGPDTPLAGGFEAVVRTRGLVARIVSMPQPVIAAVNGPAAGGGFAVAVACDVRIAAEPAKFNAAFVRIGMSGTEMGLSYLLPRIIGFGNAFEMCLTGRLVDAQEALQMGLVKQVVPVEALLPSAMDLARSIVRNSPIGVRMTKEVMWANLSAGSLPQAIELEARTQLLCTRTDDFAEALDAFRERREPVFHNS